MKPPYAIGSVPSLSGHAIAYRWRSLPRVRRHRASKPQGSSERVLPWQIIMDQLIFASLSHTHYWYEVDMLKVPRCVSSDFSSNAQARDSIGVPRSCTYIYMLVQKDNTPGVRACVGVLRINRSPYPEIYAVANPVYTGSQRGSYHLIVVQRQDFVIQ